MRGASQKCKVLTRREGDRQTCGAKWLCEEENNQKGLPEVRHVRQWEVDEAHDGYRHHVLRHRGLGDGYVDNLASPRLGN
jgi:hypothetical protein